MTWRTRSAGLPALRWPVSRPIRIRRKCSISGLGGYGPCSANEQAAIDSALAGAPVVVVAAGNDATLAVIFAGQLQRG